MFLMRFAFYALFFLTPLVLTPWNYELFEFNKMVFVYLLTVIIVGAWVGQWIVQRKIVIQRTPFDLPILLFLASQILSTIFSLDRHTSLWGYYSRFHGGLVSTICYILLYYAFVNNLSENSEHSDKPAKSENQKIRKSDRSGSLKFRFSEFSEFSGKTKVFNCLCLLLASAALVALYGIAEHFGIDANYWVQDVRNRVFSTLGQPNWLGAWIDAIILIPIAMAISKNSKHQILNSKQILNSNVPNSKRFENLNFDNWNLFRISNLGFRIFIFYSLFYILYSCLLFTGSRSAYIGFLAALFVFLALTFLWQKQFLKKLMPLLAGVFLVSLLIGTPFTPNVFKLFASLKTIPAPAPLSEVRQPPLLISSSEEIRRVVWSGAIKIWEHWPVFGSGVETFAYSYYNFRPREHNDLSEWDFLYNKAHNEYLNYLATTGIVGLGTYLLMTGWIVFWSIKRIFNFQFSIFNEFSIFKFSLKISLIAGYTSILVTNFFGFSVVPVALLFWLFPAFLLGLLGNNKKAFVYDFAKLQQFNNLTMKQLGNLQKVLLLILFVSIFYLLYSIFYRLWYSDVQFNRGRKLTQNGYLLEGQKELADAISLNSQEPLFWSQLAENSAMIAFAYSQKEASSSAGLVKQLAEIADLQAQKTLSMNPYNVNNYKSATKVYLYMSGIDPRYRQKAIATLKSAAELAPTDPKLTYNLGQIYEQANDKKMAIDYFEQTVKLKPNYLVAHLALAKLYHELGQKDKAFTELKFILDHLDPGNEETLYWFKEWQK